METKSGFVHQLQTTFPGLDPQALDQLVSENLISHFTLDLPQDVLDQAKRAVELLFSMRQKKSYTDLYQEALLARGISDPGNKSIMMSYDFHVNEHGHLKLIEINTNAAFQVLGQQMYAMRKLVPPVADFDLNEFRTMIETELKLQGKSASEGLKIAITDDKPQEQRLYIEFLAYAELFKSFGWDARIVDYRDLFKDFTPDFIYNRYTDFFLTDETSAVLRNKFLNREVTVSPNPFEYFLLADKQRMIDWGTPGFFENHGFHGEDLALLRRTVPHTQTLGPTNADEMWAHRKKLFFKPKNAFGSKLSYRGATISHKSFLETLKEDMIAQEYVPAPEVMFETPEGPLKFKYDLRCYAYQGRLQLVLARIYQGQVTNLRTKYGGFAPVRFV